MQHNARRRAMMRGLVGGCAFWVGSAALASLGAQGAGPALLFQTVAYSESRWPIAEVRTARPGYLTVVAITPGVDRFAVQVLWPQHPGDDARVKAGAAKRLLVFQDSAVSHRVVTGGGPLRPIVVGILSDEPAAYTRFARGTRWATDAVINVRTDSSTDLVRVLGGALFASFDVPFAVDVYRETAARNGRRPARADVAAAAAGGAKAPCDLGTVIGCGFLTPEDPNYKWGKAIEAANEARERARRDSTRKH